MCGERPRKIVKFLTWQIVALRLLAEAADSYVLDHTRAKRVDGLSGCRCLAHWGVLVLEVEVANPLILKTGHLPSRYPTSLLGNLPTDVPRAPQAGA
jgi:hypothetical protein